VVDSPVGFRALQVLCLLIATGLSYSKMALKDHNRSRVKEYSHLIFFIMIEFLFILSFIFKVARAFILLGKAKVKKNYLSLPLPTSNLGIFKLLVSNLYEFQIASHVCLWVLSHSK
jgi:hypothetical protein